MAKSIRKTLLALAVEAVEGTPETLAGADCFLIRNATLTPLAGNSVNREFVREVYGNYGSIQLDHSAAVDRRADFLDFNKPLHWMSQLIFLIRLSIA